MLKIKKFSMKSIPLAAAMTAALMFGAAAHAQTGISPAGGTPKTAEERDAAKPGKKAPMAAATKSQDDIVSPAPAGGTPKSAEERTAAKPGKKVPTVATTKSQDDIVSPAPAGGTPKSAEERAAAKADKKATKDAKRAARKDKVPPTDTTSEIKPGSTQ